MGGGQRVRVLMVRLAGGKEGGRDEKGSPGHGKWSFWLHIRKMFSELHPVRQPDHPRKLGEAVSPWRQGTGLIRGRMLGS
jgi:hypothetical protein